MSKKITPEAVATVDETTTPAEQPQKANKPRVGGYRLLAILVFLFTVGGLFLGLAPQIPGIGGVLGFLKPATRYSDGLFLSGSLLGHIAGKFAGFTSYLDPIMGFLSNWTAGAKSIFELLVYAMVAVAVVSALVCFIIACIPSKTGKMTKNAAMCSAILAFLGYFGLFAWNYLWTVLGETPGFAGAFDLPSAIIAGIILVLLILTAIFRSKARGIMNMILLLFTLAAIFAVIYPATLPAIYVAGSLELIKTPSALFFGAALLFVLAMLTLTLIASVARLSKRKYGFECFRFALLLVGVILMHVAFIVSNKESPWAMFTSGMPQLIPTIVLLVASIGAFIIALLCAILFGKKDKAAKAAKKEEAAATPAAEAAAPVVAPAPLSAFERKMIVLAEQGLPEDHPETEEEPAAEPVTFTPRHALKKEEEEPEQSIYDFENCTYDPFISSLTNREKNEFGDVFIANKYGALSYLPVYVVGGDNSEFFRKVFIYLGRYRKNISSSLLDKMYQQINQ